MRGVQNQRGLQLHPCLCVTAQLQQRIREVGARPQKIGVSCHRSPEEAVGAHVVSQRPRSNPALVQKYGTGWLKLHRPIQGVSCFSGALQLPQRQTALVVRVAERWVPAQ